MQIIDVNTVPDLNSVEISNDTLIFLRGVNNTLYKVSKSQLLGLCPKDSIFFKTQNGSVELASCNCNEGGYKVSLPGMKYVATGVDDEGNNIYEPASISVALATIDVPFISDTTPTLNDFPDGKAFFLWIKPSTNESFIVCSYNGTVIIK